MREATKNTINSSIMRIDLIFLKKMIGKK